MNKTTKKYIARAGIVAGLGVGAFLGAKSMETENPYKDDVESVAMLAITGAVAAVTLVGAGTLAAHSYEQEAERNRKEIELLKENLPKIREIRNPYIFVQYLAEHEPDRILPYSEAYFAITPVVNAFSRRLGPEHDSFRLEMLSMTASRIRNNLREVLEDRNNRENVTDVIEAAWFLDQTFPIAIDCAVTPERIEGEKHWFDYIQATVKQET